MLTKLWRLKDTALSILIKEYDDHCKFTLTEDNYKGIYSSFHWWNTCNQLADQQGGDSPFTSYLVINNIAHCIGWETNIEESLVNLLSATYKLTQNPQIKVLYTQATELVKHNEKERLDI